MALYSRSSKLQWRKLIRAKKTTPISVAPVDPAKQFAIDAARLANDTHCTNVVVLDLRGLSQVTDYFVLATGTSARQMRSVSDEIAELGAGRKFKALDRSGYEGESWILTDFVDVILHIFDPAGRSFYDLDNLWGDAIRVEWQSAPTKEAERASPERSRTGSSPNKS